MLSTNTILKAHYAFAFVFFYILQAGFAQDSKGKGYYIDTKKNPIKGYFDLEFLNNNVVRFRGLENNSSSELLPIENVERIVLEKENGDSSVILTQKIYEKGKEAKIYLEYLQKGQINLLRGYAQSEEQSFFISTDELPELRKINRADPKLFLFTYFPNCEEAKRRISDVYYNRWSIEFALRQFALCTHKKMEDEYRVSTKVLRKKPISLGVSTAGGIFKPYFGTGYYSNAPFKLMSQTFAGGINAQMRVFQNYSIGIAYNFIKSTIQTTDGTSLAKNLTNIQYNRHEFIPLEIKYHIEREKSSWSYTVSMGLAGGKQYNFKLNNSTDSAKTMTIKKTQGFFATGAVCKNLNKTCSIELGAKGSVVLGTVSAPLAYYPTKLRGEILLDKTVNAELFARFLVKIRQ